MKIGGVWGILKKYCVIITLFLTFMSSLCFANQATIGETSIDGIHLGMTYDEIYSIYGKYDKDEPYYNALYGYGIPPVFHYCHWGNSLKIRFGEGLGELQGIVTQIEVSNSNCENNGLYTPKGVHIGMAYDEAKRIYGISSKAELFYVLSPDMRTYMVIMRRSRVVGDKPVRGEGLVKYIGIEKIENERDRASFESLLN